MKLWRSHPARLGRRSCACVLLVLGLLATGAKAETIWSRTLGRPTLDERETLGSIERVLLGEGEERDLLRVRVALITLAKGDIEDPRAVVLLMRLRRELLLSPGRLAQRQLQQALKGHLPETMRAWAFLELGHLTFGEGQDRKALLHLEQAMTFAWRLDVRAEIMMFRGWIYLRTGRTAEAAEEFSKLERNAPSARIRLQAKVGQALGAALGGERLEFERYLRQALEIQSGRATVSGRSAFWDLELSPSEQQAVEIVMAADNLSGSIRASQKAQQICEQYRAEIVNKTPLPSAHVSILDRLCTFAAQGAGEQSGGGEPGESAR